MADAWTATQSKLLRLLADGLPHAPDELIACLPDPDQGDLSNVRHHIYALRRVLRPRGHEIVCEIYNRTLHYRHVLLLTPEHSVIS